MFLKTLGFRLCLKSAVKSLVILTILFRFVLCFLRDRRWVPASGDLAGTTQVLLAVINRIPAWFRTRSSLWSQSKIRQVYLMTSKMNQQTLLSETSLSNY